MKTSFDERASITIQKFGKPMMMFWVLASKHGLWLYATVVLVATVFVSDKTRVLDVVIPVIITTILSLFLQLVFHRHRPSRTKTTYRLWLPSYSMPSVHSSTSFAFATALSELFLSSSLEYSWVYVFAFFFLACIIAASRIVVGVHYFFDVLVGILIGITIVVVYFLLS